jgi:hypothetical protein
MASVHNKTSGRSTRAPGGSTPASPLVAMITGIAAVHRGRDRDSDSKVLTQCTVDSIVPSLTLTPVGFVGIEVCCERGDGRQSLKREPHNFKSSNTAARALATGCSTAVIVSYSPTAQAGLNCRALWSYFKGQLETTSIFMAEVVTVTYCT